MSRQKSEINHSRGRAFSDEVCIGKVGTCRIEEFALEDVLERKRIVKVQESGVGVGNRSYGLIKKKIPE